MPDKPACSSLTRKGTPCKAAPLKGTDKCMAHSDAEVRASVGFVPEAGKLGGRPRKPRSDEFIAQWFWENEGKILQAMSEALDAQRAVVVGNGPTAHVELVPDHGEQMRVVKEVFDRYFGRARQEIEISASDTDGLGAVIVLDEGLQEAARDLLRRAAQAAGEDESGGSGGGDQ